MLVEARGLYAQVSGAAREARNHSGRCLIFVNSIRAAVQSREVIDEILKHPRFISGMCDRMAVYVDSSLKKMQIARLFSSDQEKAFVSLSAALTWLHAGDPQYDHVSAMSHYQNDARTGRCRLMDCPPDPGRAINNVRI